MTKQLPDGTWLNDDGRITRFQPNPSGPGWLCPAHNLPVGQDSACDECHRSEAAKMPIVDLKGAVLIAKRMKGGLLGAFGKGTKSTL